MTQESLLSQFEMLLPLAAAWATEQEQDIVCDGVPLSEKEITDARAIGVQNPSQVRLLQVETIPRPSQPPLKAACDAIDFLTPTTRGLTLGTEFSFDRIGGGTDRSLCTSSHTLRRTRGWAEFFLSCAGTFSNV